jgi:hypothetical protein
MTTIASEPSRRSDNFGNHLSFALRNENLDLLVLKRLYEVVPRDSITAYVRSAPTGAHNRRGWFLYEFLIGRTLDIENDSEAGFTDLLDGRRYFTGPVSLSRRPRCATIC